MDSAKMSIYQLRRQEMKRKKKRITILCIAQLLAFIFIFSYAYIYRQYNKIQRLDYTISNVENNDISVEARKKMSGYWNIAVFGVDSRNSSVGKGANSDVIMIASVNRANGNIKLVSVFRDTYLNVYQDKYAKINNAYAVGGPEAAVKAINKNLDLNIKDYITFNWKAVATGINILGGVDIDISKPEFRYINGYITETVKSTGIGSYQLKSAGMQHLDGIQAVSYARLRLMDSDFARTERQRKVINQAFAKAKKSNFNTLNQLMANMLSMVATNLTFQDGLDVITEVSKYNIVDTIGFPMARGDANMGAKGWNVIPQTLESNVKELHKFLFNEENYQVSDTVKNIGYKIAVESNMYKEGKFVKSVPTDQGYVPDESTSNNTTQTNTSEEENSLNDTDNKKDKTKADIVYSIDDAGNISNVYELDEDGNYIKPDSEKLKEIIKEIKQKESKKNTQSSEIEPKENEEDRIPTSPAEDASLTNIKDKSNKKDKNNLNNTSEDNIGDALVGTKDKKNNTRIENGPDTQLNPNLNQKEDVFPGSKNDKNNKRVEEYPGQIEDQKQPGQQVNPDGSLGSSNNKVPTLPVFPEEDNNDAITGPGVN